MAKIQLVNTNLGVTTKKLYGAKVTYGWKNMVTNKPIQALFGKTELDFTGWENPLYNIRFMVPRGNVGSAQAVGSDFLDWNDWMVLVRNKPTSSSQTLLVIEVGTSTKFESIAGATVNGVDLNSTSVASSDLVSSIPVVIKGFTANFGVPDSDNAYFMTVDAQLIETST